MKVQFIIIFIMDLEKIQKRGHNDAVSVLKLNQEQDKFLSGSWIKQLDNGI